MNRTLVRWIAMSVPAVGLFATTAGAADYTGYYEGEKLSVILSADGNAYGGEIHLGQQHFPLKAHEDADHLSGSFSSQGAGFPFTATLHGNDLTLVSAGVTYSVRRLPPRPGSPLAARPDNGAYVPIPLRPDAAPATPAQADAQALAGYTVTQSTDFGKAFIREIPAKTTLAALQATFPDLARYFGARPTILGSYEDQKTHQSAYVAFSAQLNDKPIKGFVSSKVDDQGAIVMVVYGLADAPKSEWTKLTAKPATAAPANGNAAAAGNGNANGDLLAQAAQVPLHEYAFPNGTGTVGVAEGWTTNSPTLGSSVINGPADQQVIMCVMRTALTPEYWAARQQQTRGRFGNVQPPGGMMIIPYSPDPAEALKNIVAANGEVARRNGQPASTIDRIVQVTKVPPMYPGATGASIIYDVTKTTQGEAKHYRSLIQLQIKPSGQGSWSYTATQVISPAETFQRDLPVMLAQCNSLKEDAKVIQQKTAEHIAMQKEQFEATQAANKKLTDAYASQIKDIQHNSLITSRSNTNFDEIIRGVRTVEDTTTGEKTSVDLGNVDQIFDNLNRVEPDRYKQIPLRDEVYPLPGHEN